LEFCLFVKFSKKLSQGLSVVRCIHEVALTNKRKTRNIMKTNITALCTSLLLASALWLTAAEAAKTEAPKPASPEFERMKTLVGSWTGKADMGQGPIDMNIQYRLLAGGTVLEERCSSARRTRWSRCITTTAANSP
jgi:hypothetical protein